MRKIVIAAGLAAAACARSGAGTDTATLRDSAVVAGPPAAPTSSPPAESLRPRTPSSSAAAATPPASPTPAPAIGSDSVRGIVSVVGTSFEKRVMVTVSGTQRRVEVTGRLSAQVGHLAGADVAVTGALDGSRIDATSFVVRAVDGMPAIDGTLRAEGGSLYIVTANGARTRIAAPPPPLVGRDGARVWITGDPATSVSSFGFIDPPR